MIESTLFPIVAHMCERGVVPSDQLYSIISVRGTFTGTP